MPDSKIVLLVSRSLIVNTDSIARLVTEPGGNSTARFVTRAPATQRLRGWLKTSRAN